MTEVAERNGHSTRRSYTDEFRVEALARFEAAENKREFARDEGLSIGMLSRWRSEAKAGKKPKRIAARRSVVVKGSELPSSDLAALIAAIDTVRTALGPLPRKVALELLDHFRKEYQGA